MALNEAAVRQWRAGQVAAAARASSFDTTAQAGRVALSLIEAAWPVAANEFNRRRHEASEAPVRALWRKLWLATKDRTRAPSPPSRRGSSTSKRPRR
jgi:hypothetical protein